MSTKNQKSKGFFCLKNLQAKLCKNEKSSDYEFVPYTFNQEEISLIKNLENKKELKKQPAKMNLFNKKPTDLPQFHSTKIHPAMLDSSDKLIQTSEENYYKLTSTRVQKSSMSLFSIDSNLSNVSELSEGSSDSNHNSSGSSSDNSNCYSNQIYSSPLIKCQKKYSDVSDSSESNLFPESFDQYQDTFNSCDFNSVNSSFFSLLDEEIFVCCRDFTAKLQGDLNLKFGDRIKVIHRGEEFCLVQNIVTGQCGYTSLDYLTPLSHFLKNL